MTATPLRIRKAAVLGAGVMGAQIAAHLTNANVETVLFDLAAKDGPKSGIALKAIENLKKLSPAPLADKNRAAAIIPANYDEDLDQLKDVDLIIEAIAERIDWKLDLYRKIAPYVSATRGTGQQHLRPVDQWPGRGPAGGNAPPFQRRAFLQSAALHAPGRTDPDEADRQATCSKASKPS